MNRAAAVLIFSLVLVGAAHALEATQASISVDGDAGDWQGISSQPIADPSPSFIEPDADDLSASFKTSWDSERLYVLFEVMDDEYAVNGGEHVFERDGVEIMLDGGNEKATSYDSNDYKIIVQADAEQAGLFRGSLSPVSGDDVVYSATQTSDGYVLEVGVRWSLVGQAPTGGETVGFDAAVNDRDNEAYEHYMMWQWAEDHPRDTSNWGELTLTGELTPAVCGDGLREGAERCDDGNDVDADFCSNSCRVNTNAHSGFTFTEDTLRYADEELTKDLGVRVNDAAVYDTGYYSLDGGVQWEEFTLSGDRNRGDWILGSAQHDLSLSRLQVNGSYDKLVATYSCSWSDGWDCHGDGWQIKKVAVNFQEPEPLCGNDVIDPGEECDGSNLDGSTCTSEGYDAGTLSCDPDTCELDTSSCSTDEPLCGNGVVEEGEECDGADLNGNTCVSEGFDAGTLSCDPDTCELDTSSCEEYVCGNGVREPGEECDGSDLNGATCTDRGYTGGSLSCTGSCTYDENACTGATFQDSKSGDEDALQALYEAANGDSWNDNTGWSFSGMDLSDEIYGVQTELIDGEPRVTELDLHDNGLSGSIDVPELGNLKQMRLFTVTFNELDTHLPPELGYATNLEYLYLSRSDNVADKDLYPHEKVNNQGGDMHTGKNKGSEENILRGPVPPEWGNLQKLKWFIITWSDSAPGVHDGISSVPDELFTIETLEGLQIHSNVNIEDKDFPPGICDMQNLNNLALGSSKSGRYEGWVTGTVPPCFGELANLQFVRLHHNVDLTLDFDILDMSGMQSLRNFATQWNTFRGEFPDEILDGSMPNLYGFAASHPWSGGITGELPEVNTDMQIFLIYGQDIQGEIPASFWDSDILINTQFGENNFTSIGTDDLTYLGAGSSWWQIRNLRWQDNEISGPWPTLAWGTSQLDKFTRFYANGNRYVFRDMLYVPDNAPNGETVFELMQQEADVSFNYAPQKPFGEAETVMVSTGSDVSLDMFSDDVSHADNEYQWERDGSAISGETSRTLTLNNVDGGDEGTYRLIVDNPNVPRLTLQSEPVELVVE